MSNVKEGRSLNHQGTKQISTERLILRELKKSDAKQMFDNWASDSEVAKYVTWYAHEDIGVTTTFIDFCIEKYKNKNAYNWAIEFKEIGEVIGTISVVGVDEENFSCEIGYCLSRKYWNRGIMSEALRTIIRFLFTEVGLNRIVARYYTQNPASGKVMKKCGMKYEGTHRQFKLGKENEFIDVAVYAILKSDFEEGV